MDENQPYPCNFLYLNITDIIAWLKTNLIRVIFSIGIIQEKNHLSILNVVIFFLFRFSNKFYYLFFILLYNLLKRENQDNEFQMFIFDQLVIFVIDVIRVVPVVPVVVSSLG